MGSTTHPAAPDLKSDYRHLYSTTALSLFLWILLISGALTWNIQNEYSHMQRLATNAARANFDKDQAFRQWAASHGGVYVPPTPKTPPNPYLQHVPERDITTPSGKPLTLMNPAYMVRQLMTDAAALYGVKGKITSLSPLNPLNAPDPWEMKALQRFNEGAKEISEVVDIDGAPYLRLMEPMITKKECLKCHARQGYKIGDVRGGVGVAVPLTPYLELSRSVIKRLVLSYCLIGAVGVLSFLILFSQRKSRMEERQKLIVSLLESEEKWRSITESSPDLIMQLNTDLRVQFVNRSDPGTDPDEVVGKPFTALVDREQGEKVLGCLRKALRERMSVSFEFLRLRPDGTAVFLEAVAAPLFFRDKVVGLTVGSRDVTERVRHEQEKAKLEARLRQSQKMESIGTLAGGIAHDFNNILGIIMGFAEITRDDLPRESILQENIAKIMDAGGRARDLVRQILTFSRQSEDERQPLEIYPIIKETIKLLRSSLPPSIQINEQIDTECGMVLANPSHIQQIVMNLCTNAYFAMKEQGGLLTVSLGQVTLADGDLETSGPSLAPGNYVLLTVADTGCGIPHSVLDKIFEPYFTTKKRHEGTGLGLAVVHGIVKKYDGHIGVSSELDKGSTFTVYLPAISGELSGAELDMVRPGEFEGSERILVLDDEAVIVEIMKKMLTSLGYTVHGFTNAEEALHAFASRPGHYDLIISDMAMPRLNGIEFARRILVVQPQQAIILCTGFSELIDENEAKSMGIRDYLMKPIVKHDLARSVRKVLDLEKDKKEAIR